MLYNPLTSTIDDTLVYRGVIDCSTNPNYPAGDAGDLYVVSVGGKIGGASGVAVSAGDSILCNTDGTTAGTQAAKGQYWNIVKRSVITRVPTTITQSATPAINTDVVSSAHIVGLAQAITSMTTNLTGTPAEGDMLKVDITDDGTPRAITWGAGFEDSGTVTLPIITVAGVRLESVFVRNSVTSKWRCVGVS